MVATSVGVVAPFGAPDSSKEGDSVLTNVISKIAAIKEREHQATDRRPFVLWVDLQSETTMMFEYADHLAPLMSCNGIVTSGGYWHALYGRKGDILLDSDRPYNRTNVMLHDGRYYQTMKHGGRTRISAFIFSSAKTTAIMENPSGEYPLTPAFRMLLVELPFFDISVSLTNWSVHLVRKTVERQREYIAGVVATLGLAREGSPSWYSKLILRLSDWLEAISRRLRDFSS